MKKQKGFTLIATLIIIAGIALLLIFIRKKDKTNEVSENPVPTVTETPDTQTLYRDWNNYVSTRFNYSFKYPQSWNLLAYREDDPDVKFGTHSLHNYSATDIEKYMDHGIVDWKSFLGDKPAVKIDFAVHSKTINKIPDLQKFIKDSLIEGATEIPESELKIGDLETFQYKATENLGPTDVPEIDQFFAYPDKDRLVFVNLYFWNATDYETLKKSPEWQTLVRILSTFSFSSQATKSAECGVCGPPGIHNINGVDCQAGLVCKSGITTSASYCVKEEESVEKCESI